MIFQFKRQKIVRIKWVVLAGRWEGRTWGRKKKVTRQTSIIFCLRAYFSLQRFLSIFGKQNPIQSRLESYFSLPSLAVSQACVSVSQPLGTCPCCLLSDQLGCPQAKQILVVGEELLSLPGFNDSKGTFKARMHACIMLPRTQGRTVQA